MQKLFIISNESIYENNSKYFCDNLDLKSTPEGLNKTFEVNIIARKSSKERSHSINIENISIYRSILTFILAVIKSTKNKDCKYLLISISPYTFVASLFLKLFGKNPIFYLRSDGHMEYKAILGFIGPIIYHIMFAISSSVSRLISCRSHILKGKKGEVVSPSQLDTEWLSNIKTIESKNIKLLYVGRIRKEKGIFSLLKIIEGKTDIHLTIVGAENNMSKHIKQNNVILKKIENNKKKLINIYDDHKIFILPSFTEGHPMVLLEALARRRPVIIFEEIQHVIGSKKGIFISKRNYESFYGTINEILNNYKKIQEDMGQNQLNTKKQFIKDLTSYVSL